MCPARTYFIFFFFFSSSVFFLCVCEWLFALKASCFSLKPKATFFSFSYLILCFFSLASFPFVSYSTTTVFLGFFSVFVYFFHSPTFFSLKFINLQKTSLKFTLTKVSQIEINLEQKYQLKKKTIQFDQINQHYCTK